MRRSDLRTRAPLAAGLRELVEHHRSPEELRALSAEARTRGVRDIALASLQAIPERVIGAEDLARFDALLVGNRDDWWRIIALARRAYFMEFWRRDYPAVDAAERASETLCKAIRNRWCDHITMLAGGAYSQMGRADLALDRLTTAQRHARTARLPGDELRALEQLGQATGTRVADDIDTASVGDAYLDESARRYATCQMRLQRLDFATLWALQAQRYDLRLPGLRPFLHDPAAEVLSGTRATPANVLAAMQTSTLAVVVAHGVTDAVEPSAASLILSPDEQGDYLLTASKVRDAALRASPVVVLAGCNAGRVQVSSEPWSLATAFLGAGARVVIAPTTAIPDASADEVFQSLVARIRAGSDPASALVAERTARGKAAPWMSSIVVFE